MAISDSSAEVVKENDDIQIDPTPDYVFRGNAYRDTVASIGIPPRELQLKAGAIKHPNEKPIYQERDSELLK
ncbi:hypothetical protein Clacol_000615 [Clathrus columnatus]|uniref:Uncharacterized protein n=1 Tax=Clathrus columnatus TaxID=1419009 RepID=A0AAV4ZZH6_9AGAM|nr:hypothetical protein Clacol_000615 [Clathrus columnatus]